MHNYYNNCDLICTFPRALMILDELCCVSEMSDVTRNNLFPSPEEVTALSLQLALPATAGLSDNGRVLFVKN